MKDFPVIFNGAQAGRLILYARDYPVIGEFATENLLLFIIVGVSCLQVTCVGVGDVLNRGSNSIVVINTEASCSIFNIDTADIKTPTTPVSQEDTQSEDHCQFFTMLPFSLVKVYNESLWPFKYCKPLQFWFTKCCKVSMAERRKNVLPNMYRYGPNSPLKLSA